MTYSTKAHKKLIVVLGFFLAPITAFCTEGFSSIERSEPANIYYRAFTIDTRQEACTKSADVAEIKLYLQRTTISVGDRVHTNTPDDSVVSDFIIEAFDEAGNFLSGVPVSVEAESVGRTASFDPEIVYRDASMEYWEARKPGEFEVRARWLCASSSEADVSDTVIVHVVERNQ